MADTDSVAVLIDSASSKLQQLHKAFSELEGHNTVSLNLKWKELEDHFRGLENSLKERFVELEGEEREYVSKVSETEELLEKREAVVIDIELSCLERLQEKRDAVLSALFKNHRISTSEPTSSDSITNVHEEDSITNVHEEAMEDTADCKLNKSDIENPNPSYSSDENSDIDYEPHSELVDLCKRMDAKGIHEFISDNRKNLDAIRVEIPNALRSASNPFCLVLNSLKDFYTGELLCSDGKKDANLLGMRRTCLMLMESLSQLLENGDNEMLTSDIIDQAKVIASEWRLKLDGLDINGNGGNSLEVHAFLQLLATFRISSEFDEEEICKLIPAVSRRRQIADLCRMLGLQDKMTGVIDLLVNSGRQIEGVNLAYAFGLTSQFFPVALLKTYLKEVRKVYQSKAGTMSPGAQNEANERELSALKAVVKCIEEHKLEDQYPVDPLQKRILQLEKAKADKRRAAEAAKPQSKRPRANGSTYNARITTFPPQEKSFYRTPERYPNAYERQYMYPPTEHHPPPIIAAPATYTVSPTHTTYYGNGYQVHQYQPYLH